MNGPDHYREAEQLLGYIEDGALRDGVRLDEMAALSIATRAQVHATLALAAAQAMPTVARLMGVDDQITAFGRAIGWGSSFAHCGNHTGNASNRCLLAEGHSGECDDDPGPF
ncbi:MULTISPECIES: hypothetical protein [Amycolatopsis]|uniref:Uncharacterized protein n=1 Tax=Amycolatopsis albidoflavus TaxID=102226 RepID=A0ABW5I4E0_9PSEU